MTELERTELNRERMGCSLGATEIIDVVIDCEIAYSDGIPGSYRVVVITSDPFKITFDDTVDFRFDGRRYTVANIQEFKKRFAADMSGDSVIRTEIIARELEIHD